MPVINILYSIFIRPGLYLYDSFDGQSPNHLAIAVVCWWLILAIIASLSMGWFEFPLHVTAG